ncbi:MAG: hypothetical protein J6B22_02710 [Clostridia bacterium]|nr:hypothetical protein [Clostridia bacterium]
MAYINGKEVLFSPKMIKPEMVEKNLKYASGTVEFVDADNFVFYHNLGKIPRFLFIWTDIPEERSDACLGVSYSGIMPLNLNATLEDGITYTVPEHLSGYPQTLRQLTETYAEVSGRHGGYQLLTGVTYNWLVIE